MPTSLFRICTAMTSTLEIDALLDIILELTLEELRADRGSVLLYDEASDTLKMLASAGMPEEVARQGYMPRKGSIAEWVMENDEALLLNDDVCDRRFTSISENPLRSSICCPLRSRDRVTGTLNLSRIGGEAFQNEDLDALLIMATQAAVSIENASLMAENVRNARMAAIGETVAGVSHCIKNTLTALNGGISLSEMAMEAHDWEMSGKALAMLGRSVNRVSTLVLDMLDFSKERRPTRMPTHIGKIFDELVLTVGHEASRRGVAIETELDEGLATVCIDGDRIYRCLLNLATNAVEAVDGAGGKARLGARLLEAGDPATPPAPDDVIGEVRALVLSVADDGPGIDQETQARIFEPFYTTKGSKGTGIGLAVTRKIVEEHGGRVEVESTPGQGTTFRLIVPCAVAD